MKMRKGSDHKPLWLLGVVSLMMGWVILTGSLQRDQPASTRKVVGPDPLPQIRFLSSALPEPPITGQSQDSDQVAESLLNLAEQGKGPTIEVAWPRGLDDRERLFAYFSQCHQLHLGVIKAGRVTLLTHSSAAINNSGLVRLIQGDMSAAERAQYAAQPISGTPVRIFARQFDHNLLINLQQLLAGRYFSAKTIRGRYRLDSDHLLLEAISVDGLAVKGSISLGSCHHLP